MTNSRNTLLGWGMMYLIVNWVLSTAGLLGLSSLLPGFRVMQFEAALLAAGLVGLISAALGTLLKRVTGTVGLALWGAGLFAVDTLVFRVSGLVVPGFVMSGFFPAVAGALLLLLLNLVLLRFLPLSEEDIDSRSLLRS